MRVSKANPCAICKHPDWCTFEPHHQMICCMRVQSGRPAKNGGWIHKTGNAVHYDKKYHVERAPAVYLNATALLSKWVSLYGPIRKPPAKELGVSINSLELLYCTPTPRPGVWAFPMRDERGQYIGIRMRADNGAKWAEPGSKNGLFIPMSGPPDLIYIVEGPTDAAAMLTMGMWALGRPSCSACVDMTVRWFNNNRSVKRAVIVADVDFDKERPNGDHYNPGIDGAKTLQIHLPVPSVIVTIPAKDPREFLLQGGTRQVLDNIVSQLVWHRPKL